MHKNGKRFRGLGFVDAALAVASAVNTSVSNTLKVSREKSLQSTKERQQRILFETEREALLTTQAAESEAQRIQQNLLTIEEKKVRELAKIGLVGAIVIAGTVASIIIFFPSNKGD